MEAKEHVPSKDIAKNFEGQNVSVHLVNGVRLEGTAHFDGNWLNLPNERRGKHALCNLSHTISITRE